MGFTTTREKLGWRVRLESCVVMDVMDGRNDPLLGHVNEPDPMARSIAFGGHPPRTRAELHQLAEALREIENDEITVAPAPAVAGAAVPTAASAAIDEPKTDVCPVCGAYGRQHCSTRYGRDHKARALGWPTARRPKS